jgi:flagellar basal-body rod protein FlgC
MDLFKTLGIASSGMKAQSGRMKVISENIANESSTAARPGGEPYRRKVTTFKRMFDREIGAESVALGRVSKDQSPFRTRFEPGHPAADQNGMVRLPNVNSLVETMDLREAQRSYEANLNIVTATRRMIARTIDILRA